MTVPKVENCINGHTLLDGCFGFAIVYCLVANTPNRIVVASAAAVSCVSSKNPCFQTTLSWLTSTLELQVFVIGYSWPYM